MLEIGPMDGTRVLADHVITCPLSVPHVCAVSVLTSGKRTRDPWELQDLITLGRTAVFC